MSDGITDSLGKILMVSSDEPKDAFELITGNYAERERRRRGREQAADEAEKGPTAVDSVSDFDSEPEPENP